MNKKLLSILFTLFFAFAVSCSNSDKTGNTGGNKENTTGGTTVDSSKGIEQFEGNTYISDAIDGGNGTTTYQFLLIRNGKVAYKQDSTQDIPNVDDNTYYEVEGTGTDYTSKNTTDNRQKITLKFSSDGNTVTLKVGAVLSDFVLKKI